MFDEDVSIKKFRKNFLKYSPSSFIPAIIGFLTIPFLTKIFSPSDYGNYILVISIVNLLSIIINAVCGDSAIRFFTVYQKENKLKSFYDSIVVIYFVFAIILSLISFLTLNFFKNGMDQTLFNLMIVGIPLFILTTAFFVSSRLLVAKEESGIYTILVSLQSIIGFILGVILILFFNSGIYGIIWGYIISYAFFLPLIYHYAFKGKYVGKKFHKSIFLKIVKYGFPIAITNLAAWVLSIFDRYVLEYYWGSTQVGIYSASYTLSETTLVIILNLFMLAGYPAIVKLWENYGKLTTQKYISNLTRYYLLISIPTVVGISVLSKPLIEIFTSPAYYAGYIIVPIVLVGALFLGIQWWAQIGLLLHNKTHIIASAVLLAGMVNIITNFVFIPKYGFLGAAISTFLSYFTLFILIWILSKKYLKWSLSLSSLTRIILSSSIMGILIYSINMTFTNSSLVNLTFEILFGIIAYLLMLYVLGEIRKEEILFIRSLL